MKIEFRVALLALALCGCSSEHEREQREAVALAKMNAEDDSVCQSYGVAKGSPDYVSCRNNQTQVRANSAAADNAALIKSGLTREE